MCGVVGVSGSSIEPLKVKEMVAALKHRGPDGGGVWSSVDGTCGLGHVRLAILDTSDAGAQPMLSHCGRYSLVYNGEVYNFLDLKGEILSAHPEHEFVSGSDTEVILAGMTYEGIDFLRKLNGIFSILVFDNQEDKLLVLRDPLGVKPLFMSRIEGRIWFCSELNPLIVVGASKQLNIRAFKQWLAFMYVPEPDTIFKEISKVEPGVLLTVDKGEIVDQQELYDLLAHQGHGAGSDLPDGEDAVATFGELFGAAVQRQTISDVPVGLLLSGGLDSSAVAYECFKNGTKFEHAFTLGFDSEDIPYDRQSDDMKYARLIADKFDLNLHEIVVKPDVLHDLHKYVGMFSEGI